MGTPSRAHRSSASPSLVRRSSNVHGRASPGRSGSSGHGRRFPRSQRTPKQPHTRTKNRGNHHERQPSSGDETDRERKDETSGDSALRLQNQLLLHMVVQQQQQHQQQLLQQQKSIEQLHGKFNQILSSLTSETLSLPATPSLPALTAQLSTAGSSLISNPPVEIHINSRPTTPRTPRRNSSGSLHSLSTPPPRRVADVMLAPNVPSRSVCNNFQQDGNVAVPVQVLKQHVVPAVSTPMITCPRGIA